MKKRLGVKLEVARFLQDTVAEMARDMKRSRTGDVAATADELYNFINKVCVCARTMPYRMDGCCCCWGAGALGWGGAGLWV